MMFRLIVDASKSDNCPRRSVPAAATIRVDSLKKLTANY